MTEPDSPQLTMRLRQARRNGDVDFLLDHLGNPIEGSIAASYLGVLGNPKAGPALVAALDSPYVQTRRSATRALEKLRIRVCLKSV